jgi:hypothetical protein
LIGTATIVPETKQQALETISSARGCIGGRAGLS